MAKSPVTAAPKTMMTIPQTQQYTIPQAIELAGQQIDNGQLAQAEAILQQILNQHPQHAGALHLMGVLAHKAGKTILAVELIGQAIDIQPNVAHFHANRGEMCRLLNRLEEAIAHGEQAITLDPRNANAQSNLGIAYYDQKDYQRAEICQKNALQLVPNLLAALNNLGSIRRDLKDKEGAIEYYRQVLVYAPYYVEAINNLGAVLTELERPEDAITELLKVIQARPDYADAHCNIGNAFLLLEDLDKALFAFNHALTLAPESISAILGLARTYKEKEALAEARNMVDRVLALDPKKAEAHALSGDIYTQLSDYNQAEQAYQQALALDENALATHLGLGQLHLELGRIDEAQASFERAMAISPEEIAPYVFMAQAKKMKNGDATLARLETEAQDIDSMRPTRAMSLHFALGKAYDDLKQYDQAFPHFAAGCKIKRERIQYDADMQDKITQDICEFFTKKTIAKLRGAGDASDVPIFVLGMPRSGTTLTETIIASHPDVYGAGELRDLLALANEPISGVASQPYPLSMQGLTKADLTQMGAQYVAGLRKHAASAKHITDKMPANFLALGLIHLMLPNAKIIHIKRNAADICLSGFTKLFNNSQYHTYDLTEMARYYVNYAKVMEHWRKVLPASAFLELQYEDLVTDKDAQSRRLIDFCGLEWNSACLESHKTERSVKTASITQVRQPVYTSSVERWKRYEKHLQPLLDTLGKYAPAQ